MTASDFTGGCQCGAVRYRAKALGASGICHCRMCQRAAGNLFAPLVTATGVEWQGEPARWASSNVAERGFCANCGTPLFLRGFSFPEGTYEIMTATLDDPEIAPPAHQTGIESRISWTRLIDGLPESETTGGLGGGVENIISQQSPASAAAKEDP